MFTKSKFTYTGKLDNPFWEDYFSMSKIGKEYTILTTDKPSISIKDPGGIEMVEDLIMCDTEYEAKRNQPFYDLCKKYKNPRVLSIGYGIGYILDEMEVQNASLTIVEKYQEVLDLETRDISQHNIIVSDVNDLDFESMGKFDVVFLDMTGELNKRKELIGLVADGGKFIEW